MPSKYEMQEIKRSIKKKKELKKKREERDNSDKSKQTKLNI